MLTEQHVEEEEANQFGVSSSLDIDSNHQINTEKPDLVNYKFDLDENFMRGDIKVSIELVYSSEI